MTFHNFRNLFQFGNNVFIHRAFFELYADVGASGIAEHFRIDVIAGAGNDFRVNHALDSLVDCRTRYAAYNRNILRRDARVFHYDFKYFSVKIVNLFHFMWFFLILGKDISFF